MYMLSSVAFAGAVHVPVSWTQPSAVAGLPAPIWVYAGVPPTVDFMVNFTVSDPDTVRTQVENVYSVPATALPVRFTAGAFQLAVRPEVLRLWVPPCACSVLAATVTDPCGNQPC